MIRLFVGVGLPEDVRLRLTALCGGVPGAKWVEPENFHLTLRFIGEVDEGEADDIHDALGAIRSPRYDIALAGVRHFETSGHVHTIWVGVEKSAELMALQARVESALARVGVPRETRRFKPHVTLARLREIQNGYGGPGLHGGQNARVSAFLAHHALFRAGPIPVDEFLLFSSHLRNAGPIYRVEAEYPLALVEA